MSQATSYAGKHGRAAVDFRNGLWRVVWDGRADWYVSACQVALALAHDGKAPAHIASLLDLSNRHRRWS
jgi:hypothetical protein